MLARRLTDGADGADGGASAASGEAGNTGHARARVPALLSRRVVVARGGGLGLTAMFAAACGTGGQSTGPAAPSALQPASLVVLHNTNQAAGQVVTDRVAQYQREFPQVKAEYNLMTAGPAYADKLQATLASGAPLDIFWQGGWTIFSAITRGLTAELEPLIARDKWDKGDWYEPALEIYRWQNRLFGLPWNFGYRMLFYNQSLFQQAGLQPPPNDWKANGWTFDDLTNVTRQLQKGEGDQITQAGLIGMNDLENISAFVYAAGGRWVSEDHRTVSVDMPEVAEGLQFVQDLLHRHRGATTSAQEQVLARSFESGKAALSVTSTINGVAVYRPVKDLRWDAAPIARGPKRRAGERKTFGGGSGWFISRQTKAKDQTWHLLQYLTSKDTLTALAEGGIPPARKSVAAGPAWLGSSLAPASKKIMNDGSAEVISFPKLTNGGDVQARIQEGLRPLLANTASVPQVVSELRRMLDPLLQQHRDELAKAKP